MATRCGIAIFACVSYRPTASKPETAINDLPTGSLLHGGIPLVFWLLLLGLISYSIAICNTLATLKNYYLNAFAQIEVPLKRRHDLRPNLVETATASMAHEIIASVAALIDRPMPSLAASGTEQV